MKIEISFYIFILSIIYFSVNGAPRFSGDQLHHIDIGLIDTDGQIGCFGDFDNDRLYGFNDIINYLIYF